VRGVGAAASWPCGVLHELHSYVGRFTGHYVRMASPSTLEHVSRRASPAVRDPGVVLGGLKMGMAFKWRARRAG
jgi:hypothetical protein